MTSSSPGAPLGLSSADSVVRKFTENRMFSVLVFVLDLAEAAEMTRAVRARAAVTMRSAFHERRMGRLRSTGRDSRLAERSKATTPQGVARQPPTGGRIVRRTYRHRKAKLPR